MRSSFVLVACALMAACLAAACAAGGVDTPEGTPDSGGGPAKDAGTGPKKDAQASSNDASSSGNPDAGATDATTTSDASDAGITPKPIVFGHSPDTLYSFDVTTNLVTEIGAFSGCTQNTISQVIDIAVDANNNGYATTFDGVYSVDLSTAQCTLIKTGSYPNCCRSSPRARSIRTSRRWSATPAQRTSASTRTSGDMTTVGALSGGYASSGDIVSVENGGTFLTVTGNGCGDCLLQVDPKTGDIIQSYGQLPHGAVYGLAFWAGSLYGFDDAGDSSRSAATATAASRPRTSSPTAA